MITRGFDISKWQGAFDWRSVRGEAFGFAYIRASNGMNADPCFPVNLPEARGVALQPGAYHYFQTGDYVESQVRFFLDRHIPIQPTDAAPWVDVEQAWPSNIPLKDRAQEIEAFLTLLQKELPETLVPCLYGGPSFLDANFEPDHTLGKWPLAVAYYTRKEPWPSWYIPPNWQKPPLPRGWTDWKYWQYGQLKLANGCIIDGDVRKD